MADPITVVIADDHPPTRAGVKAALEAEGFRIVGEYGDASSAVAAVAEHRPDVCILDIHMPGNGIAAASKISSGYPDTAVVMLTISTEDSDLFDALRAGASGYLLKDTSPDRLPIALKGVLSGEAALPRHLMSRVLDEFRQRGSRRLPTPDGGASLSSREWEVLDLMAQGLSTAEMAQSIFVSKVTIRSHVASIIKKLGVRDRRSAIEAYRGSRGS